MKYIQLGHRVITAEWSEADSAWELKVQVVETGEVIHDRCDILLSATGVLKYFLYLRCSTFPLPGKRANNFVQQMEMAIHSRNPRLQGQIGPFGKMGRVV
jgi:hypothetical protein